MSLVTVSQGRWREINEALAASEQRNALQETSLQMYSTLTTQQLECIEELQQRNRELQEDWQRKNEQVIRLVARLDAAEKLVEQLIECVPTSWLDDILTGPDAVIGEQPWGCPEVESILRAVRQRMVGLATPAQPAAGEERTTT